MTPNMGSRKCFGFPQHALQLCACLTLQRQEGDAWGEQEHICWNFGILYSPSKTSCPIPREHKSLLEKPTSRALQGDRNLCEP